MASRSQSFVSKQNIEEFDDSINRICTQINFHIKESIDLKNIDIKAKFTQKKAHSTRLEIYL